MSEPRFKPGDRVQTPTGVAVVEAIGDGQYRNAPTYQVRFASGGRVCLPECVLAAGGATEGGCAVSTTPTPEHLTRACRLLADVDYYIPHDILNAIRKTVAAALATAEADAVAQEREACYLLAHVAPPSATRDDIAACIRARTTPPANQEGTR